LSLEAAVAEFMIIIMEAAEVAQEECVSHFAVALFPK
jgi:hypothetical protein